MGFHKALNCIGLVVIWTMVSAGPAFAYLDPGTGGAITTAILGVFAAIVFTCRKYFYKMLRVVRGSKEQTADPSANKPD